VVDVDDGVGAGNTEKLLTKYREHLGAFCDEPVDPLIWTLRIKGLTQQKS
jgi:hypothetical protein